MAQWRSDYLPEAQAVNEDLKAKMRKALDAKNEKERGVSDDQPLQEKVHGSEVDGGAGPQMHRRKAGGGGT